jgi:hypothetical protein
MICSAHPFGSLKFWMGSAHFMKKRLHNVKTEMPLRVLPYKLKRVMNIPGVSRRYMSLETMAGLKR